MVTIQKEFLLDREKGIFILYTTHAFVQGFCYVFYRRKIHTKHTQVCNSDQIKKREFTFSYLNRGCGDR